jgi:hypothetical protein
MNKTLDILSDNEIEKLILALANGKGQFTKDEAQLVIDWAGEIRLGVVVLESVIEGKVVITGFDDGELVFGLSNST